MHLTRKVFKHLHHQYNQKAIGFINNKAILVFCFMILFADHVTSEPATYIGLTPEDRQVLSQRGLLRSSLSLPQANYLIKEIFKLGRYETVELITEEKDDKIYWKIIAQPNRKIADIVITGHNVLSQNQIMNSLNKGEVFIYQELLNDVEKIKEQYREIGYLDVKIDLNFEDTQEQSVLVKMNIEEGLPCQINSIDFVTPHQKIKELLLKRVRSFVGKKYTKEYLQEVTNKLQQFLFQKGYLRATFLEYDLHLSDDKKTVDIVYIVKDPYYFSIHLNISNEEFIPSLPYKKPPPTSQDVMKALLLNEVDGLTSTTVLSQRVRDFYKSQGYSKVKVSVSENILSENFEHRIFFDIQPGYRFYVKAIEIMSLNKERNAYYLKLLRSHRSYFTRLSEPYVKDQILKDIDMLISTLQNQGYLRARMQSLIETFHPKNKTVSLRIVINEGFLTKIKSVHFTGNQHATDEDLLELLKLNLGEPLNLSLLENGFETLKEYYFQKGFLHFKISNPDEIITYNNNNTLADIHFDLNEGPEVKVQNILVQGNEKTNSDVILKELAFQPGSILTWDLIKESQYRLQQTGLFSNVDISLPEVSQHTVLVRVTERNPGILRFLLGANNEFDLTFRGSVGLGYRNLWGTARGINTRLELRYANDVNFLGYTVGMSYYEPFIFSSRTRGRINLVHSRDLESLFQRSDDILIEDSTALDLLLEREVNRQVTLNYTLWKLEIEKRFYGRSNDEIERQSIGSTGPGIEFDYRNDPFNTTKGIYSQFNLDFADPLLGSTKSIRYLRFSGGFNIYTPLLSKIILASSMQGGYITNLNRSRSLIPESRVFFLGGQSTLRGYELNSIPNRSGLLEDESMSLTIPTYSYFYLLKSELRFAIFKALGGVLFYDGGGVNIDQRHQEDEYRDAVGLGIRIATPVGPVSIEYGFKLRKRSEESLGRLHFSIGAF